MARLFLVWRDGQKTKTEFRSVILDPWKRKVPVPSLIVNKSKSFKGMSEISRVLIEISRKIVSQGKQYQKIIRRNVTWRFAADTVAKILSLNFQFSVWTSFSSKSRFDKISSQEIKEWTDSVFFFAFFSPHLKLNGTDFTTLWSFTPWKNPVDVYELRMQCPTWSSKIFPGRLHKGPKADPVDKIWWVNSAIHTSTLSSQDVSPLTSKMLRR